MNRVVVTIDEKRIGAILNDTGVAFTLAGLKKFLNEVEVSEGYVEGAYGDEVMIPLGLLLRCAKNSKAEVEAN